MAQVRAAEEKEARKRAEKGRTDTAVKKGADMKKRAGDALKKRAETKNKNKAGAQPRKLEVAGKRWAARDAAATAARMTGRKMAEK